MARELRQHIDGTLGYRGMPAAWEPNAMYHPCPRDCWDEYENDKYKEEIGECSADFSRARAGELRRRKLAAARRVQPWYGAGWERRKAARESGWW